MRFSENDPANMPRTEQLAEPVAAAPAWHTVVLVVGILALSVHGAARFSVAQVQVNRLATYGSTAAMELGLLAWVAVGLRLRKIPFRLLLGSCRWSLRSIAADLRIAFAFWVCALMVLGTVGIAWSGAEAALAHRPLAAHAAGQPFVPDPSQEQALHALLLLAPADGKEIAAWALLCVFVGFVEEIVFRGYLQRQFTAWARGGVGAGVLLSAVVFGGAHAYQGARNMVLLTVFGALFGLLAIYRRGLRANIFVHSWHDLIAGLALALLRAKHIL